eukprot:CFRG8595T1
MIASTTLSARTCVENALASQDGVVQALEWCSAYYDRGAVQPVPTIVLGKCDPSSANVHPIQFVQEVLQTVHISSKIWFEKSNEIFSSSKWTQSRSNRQNTRVTPNAQAPSAVEQVKVDAISTTSRKNAKHNPNNVSSSLTTADFPSLGGSGPTPLTPSGASTAWNTKTRPEGLLRQPRTMKRVAPTSIRPTLTTTSSLGDIPSSGKESESVPMSSLSSCRGIQPMRRQSAAVTRTQADTPVPKQITHQIGARRRVQPQHQSVTAESPVQPNSLGLCVKATPLEDKKMLQLESRMSSNSIPGQSKRTSIDLRGQEVNDGPDVNPAIVVEVDIGRDATTLSTRTMNKIRKCAGLYSDIVLRLWSNCSVMADIYLLVRLLALHQQSAEIPTTTKQTDTQASIATQTDCLAAQAMSNTLGDSVDQLFGRGFVPAFASISAVCLFASEALMCLKQLVSLMDTRSIDLLRGNTRLMYWNPALSAHLAGTLENIRALRIKEEKDKITPRRYKPKNMLINVSMSYHNDDGRGSGVGGRPEPQAVVHNRENCRDSFQNILREWLTSNSLVGAAGGRAGGSGSQSRGGNGSDSLGKRIKMLMNDLLEDNIIWFAGLFVGQLLRIAVTPPEDDARDDVRGSSGVSDRGTNNGDSPLAKLRKQDYTKFDQLSKRLVSNGANQGGSTGGRSGQRGAVGGTRKGNGSGSARKTSKNNHTPVNEIVGGAALNAENPEGQYDISGTYAEKPSTNPSKYTGSEDRNLHIFWRFLTTADSYRFTLHLATCILNRIDTLNDQIRGKESIGIDEFEEHWLKLHVLGKCLGVATFFPLWNLSSTEHRNTIPHVMNLARVVTSVLLRSPKLNDRLTTPWVTSYLLQLGGGNVALYSQPSKTMARAICDGNLLDSVLHIYNASGLRSARKVGFGVVFLSVDQLFESLGLTPKDVKLEQLKLKPTVPEKDYFGGDDCSLPPDTDRMLTTACPVLLAIRSVLYEAKYTPFEVVGSSKISTTPYHITPSYVPSSSISGLHGPNKVGRCSGLDINVDMKKITVPPRTASIQLTNSNSNTPISVKSRANSYPVDVQNATRNPDELSEIVHQTTKPISEHTHATHPPPTAVGMSVNSVSGTNSGEFESTNNLDRTHKEGRWQNISVPRHTPSNAVVNMKVDGDTTMNIDPSANLGAVAGLGRSLSAVGGMAVNVKNKYQESNPELQYWFFQANPRLLHLADFVLEHLVPRAVKRMRDDLIPPAVQMLSNSDAFNDAVRQAIAHTSSNEVEGSMRSVQSVGRRIDNMDINVNSQPTRKDTQAHTQSKLSQILSNGKRGEKAIKVLLKTLEIENREFLRACVDVIINQIPSSATSGVKGFGASKVQQSMSLLADDDVSPQILQTAISLTQNRFLLTTMDKLVNQDTTKAQVQQYVTEAWRTACATGIKEELALRDMNVRTSEWKGNSVPYALGLVGNHTSNETKSTRITSMPKSSSLCEGTNYEDVTITSATANTSSARMQVSAHCNTEVNIPCTVTTPPTISSSPDKPVNVSTTNTPSTTNTHTDGSKLQDSCMDEECLSQCIHMTTHTEDTTGARPTVGEHPYTHTYSRIHTHATNIDKLCVEGVWCTIDNFHKRSDTTTNDYSLQPELDDCYTASRMVCPDREREYECERLVSASELISSLKQALSWFEGTEREDLGTEVTKIVPTNANVITNLDKTQKMDMKSAIVGLSDCTRLLGGNRLYTQECDCEKCGADADEEAASSAKTCTRPDTCTLALTQEGFSSYSMLCVLQTLMTSTLNVTLAHDIFRVVHSDEKGEWNMRIGAHALQQDLFSCAWSNTWEIDPQFHVYFHSVLRVCSVVSPYVGWKCTGLKRLVKQPKQLPTSTRAPTHIPIPTPENQFSSPPEPMESPSKSCKTSHRSMHSKECQNTHKQNYLQRDSSLIPHSSVTITTSPLQKTRAPNSDTNTTQTPAKTRRLLRRKYNDLAVLLLWMWVHTSSLPSGSTSRSVAQKIHTHEHTYMHTDTQAHALHRPVYILEEILLSSWEDSCLLAEEDTHGFDADDSTSAKNDNVSVNRKEKINM